MKNIDREEQIEEIMMFVHRHPESQASRAVTGRILGTYYTPIDRNLLSHLGNALVRADDTEIEACYYIIK